MKDDITYAILKWSWWSTVFPLLVSNQALAARPNWVQLEKIAMEKRTEWENQRLEAERMANLKGLAIRKEVSQGVVMEIQRFEGNNPVYYITDNLNAAKTTRTDKIWPTGVFSVTGTSYSQLAEWDGGAVRTSHQEFGGRVIQADGALTLSDHATHVAGTLVASGVVPAAKGMAYEANLSVYDWNNDTSEMATAAATGLEISNHSYGYITGWYYNGLWYWYGNASISPVEDYKFGFYDSQAQQWDEIAHNAPNYLIVKAAGNDRNDPPPPPGTSHWFLNNGTWTQSLATRDPDGGSDGFDSLSGGATAKNVLTVGAVDDMSSYVGPDSVVMTAFSAWGPTDDGRIKPDLVANGVSVYSAIKTSNTAYASYGGTSMASPNAAGTLALLQAYYKNLHTNPMRSATLKALVIHTVDEAGSTLGPDYKFGWGLLNAERAAQVITQANQQDNQTYLSEIALAQGTSYDLVVTVPTGTPQLRATIAWTDPPGTPTVAVLNPTTRMLVNDLDLRIIRNSDSVKTLPWVLQPLYPTKAAKRADNIRDNVEQVYLKAPIAGNYTIRVTHKGTLKNGSQDFSLVITM